jgi:multidrug efflux pump subunit AcrA (membrane-fusion protein)
MKIGKRRGLFWLLAAVVVLALLAGALLLGRAKRPSQENWSQSYRRVAVEAISYQPTVEVSGNLEPAASRELAFPMAGRVVQIAVQPGQSVEKNAVVARLDDGPASYELQVVESALEQKRLSGSLREVKLLELERNLKARAVQDRALLSPVRARVSSVDAQEGDYVTAGRRIARVVDISSLKAKVQIDELDAPLVKVGQAVRFSFDALPELQAEGRVVSLSIEGRLTSEGLAVRDGEVQIDRPPAELLAGYSFTAEILVGERRDLLALPEEALFKSGGTTFVLVAPRSGEAPQRRAVEAALLDLDRVRILSGLQSGEQVLVPLVRDSGNQPARLSTKSLLQSLQSRARLRQPSAAPAPAPTEAEGSR